MSADSSQNPFPTATHDVLNSWKEIAEYLDRGVRTVQRWEADLGLPVRRPRGKSRSAVIAMRADLDRWLEACPLNVREHLQQGLSFSKEMDVKPANDADCPDVLMQSRMLRFRLEQTRLEFRQAVENLTATLQHMTNTK